MWLCVSLCDHCGELFAKKEHNISNSSTLFITFISYNKYGKASCIYNSFFINMHKRYVCIYVVLSEDSLEHRTIHVYAYVWNDTWVLFYHILAVVVRLTRIQVLADNISAGSVFPIIGFDHVVGLLMFGVLLSHLLLLFK
jgi:hypothetical protein